MTRLFEAAKDGDAARLTSFLPAGAVVDAAHPDLDDGEQTALMMAAQRGHEEAVRLVLGFRASLYRQLPSCSDDTTFR